MHLSVAILFLVTTIVNRGCYAIDPCPVGAPLKAAKIDGYSYCENNNVMFSGHTNPSHGSCCESYATTETCKHTGMRSKIFSNFDTYTSWYYAMTKQHTDDRYAGYVYDVRRGSKQFVCPYPMGFLWYAVKLTRWDTPEQEYLPVDHKDTTSILKTCEANKDCAADEFCGDVINYSDVENFERTCHTYVRNYRHTYGIIECTGNYDCYKISEDYYCDDQHYRVFVDRKVHFCYKNPKLDQNRGKTQLAMDSSQRNLKFCQSNPDCMTEDMSSNCHTTLAPLASSSSEHIPWTKFIPDPDTSKEGSKMKYLGLCVEDIPYSYILSHIFDSLSERNQLGEVGKKFLPVDYDAVKKRRDQLKKCDYNKDCGKGQFCGTIYSLREPANQHPNVRFCFTSIVHNDASKRYTALPNKQDIITCETAADCVAEDAKNSICYISGGINYLKNDENVIKLMTGICAEDKAVEEDGSSMMIIVVVVVLVVIILAALIGGFVFYKLKMKKGKNGKKGKNDKSELTKKTKKEKKDKKGKKKKNKKGNKTSESTASTTKSTSMTGQSGMGTTTGGYSPAIY